MTSLADLLAPLDGVQVRAQALGWDDAADSSDFALDRSDLPRLTTLIGALTVREVPDLQYTQFVVNGIPVDPATITPIDYFGHDVLVAAGGWAKVPRKKNGEWTSGPDEAGAPDDTVPDDENPYAQPTDPYAGMTKSQIAGVKAAATKKANIAAKAAEAQAAKKAKLSAAGVKAALTKKKNAEAAAAAALAAQEQLDAGASLAGAEEIDLETQQAMAEAQAAAAQQGLVDAGAPVNAELEALLNEGPPPEPKPSGTSGLDQALADSAVSQMTKMGKPPTAEQLDAVSGEALVGYLHANVSAKNLAKVPATKEGRVELAKAIAAQHTADVAALESLGHYIPLAAHEARRAMLRETGQRKPTGGPGTTSPDGSYVHQFYSVDTISSLPIDKVKAILSHHKGGKLSPAHENMSDNALRALAVDANSVYRSTVESLIAQGVPASTIPHSLVGASARAQGTTIGLSSPLVKDANQAAVAQPIHAVASKHATTTYATPVPSGPTPKPADWHSWSPGKKAAWTKKNNLKLKGLYTGPMPTGSGTATQNLTPSFEGTSEGVFIPKSKGAKAPIIVPQPGPSHTVHVESSSSAARKRYVQRVDLFKDENDVAVSSKDHSARVSQFNSQLSYGERSAWASYTGSGYRAMNPCLKYGQGCTDKVVGYNNALLGTYAKFGTPSPKQLYRGKNNGPMADLTFKVGDVYVEPAFGSWASTTDSPKGFASAGTAKRSIIYRIKDTKGMIGIPGTLGERETIVKPGTRFRVTGIEDFITGDGVEHHRVMDVEIVED